MHSTNFTKGNDTTLGSHRTISTRGERCPAPYQRLFIKKLETGEYQVRMWSPGARGSNIKRRFDHFGTHTIYWLAVAEKDRRREELFKEYMRGL